MSSTVTLTVAKDFSRFPAGRYLTDGPHSGERFRAMLVQALGDPENMVIVILDGTMGYGSSFLEEAFGGLVRLEKFSARDLKKRLTITSSDDGLVREVWSYINDAR